MRNDYILIIVIIDKLTKIIYNKLVKTTLDLTKLIKFIFDLVIRYQSFLNSILSNKNAIFKSKFWLLLYYFLGINQRLFTIFQSLVDGQTKRQNSIIKDYVSVFINLEKNNSANFFSIA